MSDRVIIVGVRIKD